MKQRFKRLVRSDRGQSLLAFGLANYLRFVDLTSRTRIDPKDAKAYTDQLGPVIYAGWHAHVLAVYKAFYKKNRPHVLASPKADGQFVAKTLVHMGHKGIIEGAGNGRVPRNRRKANRAFMALIKLLRDGQSVCLTADVPKGPAYQSGEGVILLARKAGVPIVPMAIASSRAIKLDTWDKFQIHRPFCTFGGTVGAPMNVPDDGSALINHQEALDKALNDLSHKAMMLCGLKPDKLAQDNKDPDPQDPPSRVPDKV